MSPERSGSPQEQASTPKMSVPGSPVAGTPPRDAESPISLLLAVAQCQNSRANDDDLTSLSWLHERDVLKGINLVNPSPSSSVHTTPVKASTLSPSANSPTSDYVDESLESTPDSSNGSLHSPTPYHNNNNINGGPGRVKHPHNVPYDPMIHTTSKPPYSFSSLIFMAIEDSEQKALPVKEIYAWIVDHFPYFKNAPNGWKNSVRHNLSLNKSFQKVEKAPNLGKGSLWTVHSPSRPSLVQQLTRSPFHPCSTLDPAIYNKPTTFDKGIYYRLPNPELFPYLSRSLAENGLKQETKMEATSDDSLDAVDAATVMLSLRNGPRHQHRKSKSFQIITNSPSEDHTYSAIENVIVSPDIAFESDEEKYSTSKSFICRKIDFEDEEERKIQEGAETLLNLAGITTKKRFSTHNIDFTNSKRKKVNHFVVPANTTEKPTLFRPRLLRAKRKDKISNNNNNNNNKFSSIQDDWARHRREMEEKKKR